MESQSTQFWLLLDMYQIREKMYQLSYLSFCYFMLVVTTNTSVLLKDDVKRADNAYLKNHATS
jgi:hypothetical protein